MRVLCSQCWLKSVDQGQNSVLVNGCDEALIHIHNIFSFPHDPKLATGPAQPMPRNRGRRPGVQVLGSPRTREGRAGAKDRHHTHRDYGRSCRVGSECRALLKTVLCTCACKREH